MKSLKLVIGCIAITFLAWGCSKHSYDTFDTSPYKSSSEVVYLENSISNGNDVEIRGSYSSEGELQLSLDSLSINLRSSYPVKSETSRSIEINESAVVSYNETHETNLKLLPSTAYSLDNKSLTISEGKSVSDGHILIQLKKDEIQGEEGYLLPIEISESSDDNNARILFISITISSAPPENIKPAGQKQILYVEVNDNNPLNAGNYYLKDSEVPFFDVVNLFAANINYDKNREKPYIFFNQQVTSILSNREKYIVPLQKKGIKVVLALLNNHDGVGFDNFVSESSINDFALQVKEMVDFYQLDGIDIDDEYAEYGSNGQPAVNDSSLVLLVKRLRELMPDKIISYYYFSDAISIPRYSEWNGLTVGQYVDYTYQGVYGFYSVPNISGLTDKGKIGPYSVNLANFQRPQTLASNANRVKSEDYGIFMWYNLSSVDRASWFSSVSQVFFNEDVIYDGEAFEKDY